MPAYQPLFIALNNSNAFVKHLTAPLLTLLFYSPLVLLASHYFGFTSSLPLDSIRNYSPARLLSAVLPYLAAAVAVCLATRFLSGSRAAEEEVAPGTPRRIPAPPYWIPGLGSLPEFLLRERSTLEGGRDASPHGIFALNLAGRRHNIVTSPSLIRATLAKAEREEPCTLIDANLPTILHRVYGLPPSQQMQIRQIISSTEDLRPEALQKHLEDLVPLFLKRLEENLPHLVTFMASPVDQMPWERATTVTVSKTNDEVTIDLPTLLREFIGHTFLPILLGTTHLDNHPSIPTDLATLSNSFHALATGLPRWLPLPGLVPAHLARRHLLTHLTTPPTDPPSPLLPLLHSTLPRPLHTPLTLTLLHTLLTPLSTLTTRTVLHLLSNPSPLRTQTHPHATPSQPAPAISPLFPEPPRLTFHPRGPSGPAAVAAEQLRRTPLLRRALMRAAAEDDADADGGSGMWRTFRVERDTVLAAGKEEEAKEGKDSFVLGRGEFVSLVPGMAEADAAAADDVDAEPEDQPLELPLTALLDDVLRRGDGRLAAAAVVQRCVAAAVVGVLQLWDVDVLDSGSDGKGLGGWGKGGRVRLRRRKLEGLEGEGEEEEEEP